LAPLRPTRFPYTTLFRSQATGRAPAGRDRTCRPDRREACSGMLLALELVAFQRCGRAVTLVDGLAEAADGAADNRTQAAQALGRSEEHTSELQSRENLVC